MVGNDDSRFFLATKDSACTLSLRCSVGVGPSALASPVGVGLSGGRPTRKDESRREAYRRYGKWLLGRDGPT